MTSLLQPLSDLNLAYIKAQAVLLAGFAVYALLIRWKVNIAFRGTYQRLLLLLSMCLPLLFLFPRVSIQEDSASLIMPALRVTATVYDSLQVPAAMGVYTIMGLLGLVGIALLAARVALQWRWERTSLRTSARTLTAGRVKVVFSSDVRSPFSTGIFRHTIFLPVDLTPAVRSVSFRHEANHIRRGHIALSLIELVHRTLFWYNPWAHFLRREGELLREIECDEAVCREVPRVEYGRILVDQAQRILAPQPAVLANSLNSHSLKKRITYLMEDPMRGIPKRILVLSVAALVTGVVLVIGFACNQNPAAVTDERANASQVTDQNALDTIQDTQPAATDPAVEEPAVKEPTPPPSPTEASLTPTVEAARSKASIYRVVMQNIQALRYVYNTYLKTNPDMQGKVVIKISIDEGGTVIACEVVSSDIGNADFEAALVNVIRNWKFGAIDKPGDVTEIVYPFTFSQ